MSEFNTDSSRLEEQPSAGQQSQLPPPRPGQQRSGYPAGPPEPGQPGYRPPSEPRAAAPRDEKAEAERRLALAAASIGGQVILDFNEDGSLGARGGAAGTLEENTMARDAWLGEMGLDPVNCSGPARARVEGEEEAQARPAPPPPDARATRASSLAAGISQGARP